jgi:formylmethanofuran dehydrogenase subunit A
MDKVSTLSVLKTLCQAQQALGLAHPVHVHGPRLGEPGNVGITAEMIRALAGWPLHLAHLQYYCYGQDEHGRHRSDVASLVGTLSDLPSVTADLGLVAFGPAFTATADQPLEFGLVRHVGTPSTPAVFCDHENEDGFGIMPLKHKPNVAEHAIQWATGLELALSWDDPWRYALTVDHPNGGSFLNYPGLIALLMSRPRREEALAGVHRAARDRTGLGAIQREMTLSEIATITRAAPARALGMSDRGHLRPGARGDVAIYEDRPDEPEAMFSRAKHVIKAGRFIVRDGVCLDDTPGERLRERLEPSDQGAALLRDWAGRFGSFAPGQLVAGC